MKFANEIEERYFRTFQTETAAELAGVFDSTFWDCLLLQTCLEEPFAKMVVMALAAMSKSRKLSQHIDSDPAYRSVVAQQKEFAYKQYQTALKEMRTSLQKSGDSRKAVIGCLLVCCFESLVGNTASAHANALSGQRLLEQWVAEHPYKKLHEVGILSPASHLIEDDIIQASFFFDSQVTAYLDPRPSYIHAALRHEGDETIAQMPEKFQTIREAHSYSVLFFRRTLHSCREIGELAGTGRLSTTSDYQILEKEMSALSPVPVEHPRTQAPIEDARDFVAQQQQYSLENQRWRSAFHDLFERMKLSGNKRQQSAAYALLATSRAFDVALVLALDKDNCSCDQLAFEFKEINSLTREVIKYTKSQNSNSDFTFNLAVNSALYICARFCRERTTRREAISLLQMHGVREGYFDSKYSTAMCTKIMELEEESVETDYVPGSARVRMIEETVHPEERWSTFHYIRGSEETIRVGVQVVRAVLDLTRSSIPVMGILRCPSLIHSVEVL